MALMALGALFLKVTLCTYIDDHISDLALVFSLPPDVQPRHTQHPSSHAIKASLPMVLYVVSDNLIMRGPKM